MTTSFISAETTGVPDELATVLSGVGDLVTVHDLDGRIRLASESSRAILGVAPGELVGRMPEESFVYAEDVVELSAAIERLRKGDETAAVTFRARTESGQAQWLESRIGTMRDASGAAGGLVAVSRVVTEREQTHEALRRSEASFSSAFDYSPIGMVITAPDNSLLRVNDAFCELTKRSRAELHSASWRELIHPDDLESCLELTGRILGGQMRTAMVEKRYVRPDNSVVNAVMSITLVRDEQDRPLHLVTQVLDVTDRHRLETYLEELALRDPLTGAHNRRALEVELSSRLAAESAGTPGGALVLLDIDHFKDVNDTFGHNTGDDVLRHLVAEWRRRLRRNDVLVRTGGDEFVVLLGDADPDSAESVARDLLALADTAILTVTGVASSVSAGMALLRADEEPAELLRRADEALYLAKRGGRGRLVIEGAEARC